MRALPHNRGARSYGRASMFSLVNMVGLVKLVRVRSLLAGSWGATPPRQSCQAWCLLHARSPTSLVFPHKQS